MRRLIWLLVCAASCGGDGGTDVEVLEVVVAPAAELAVGEGDTVRFTAAVRSRNASRAGSVQVLWSVRDPGIASVDARGLVTARAGGTTEVVATAGGAAGSASLEVWVAPAVERYVAGTSYLGRRGYVEYIPGELYVVLSAPHGGGLEPGEIADRTFGETATDRNTVETLLAVREAMQERTGLAPHVVISHLKRTKLDPNREIAEGAQANPFAENAWQEFHRFVEIAEAAVAERHASGLYLDLHGHGHEIARAELGYLLSAATLARPDPELDAGGHAASSSIRALAERSARPFSELLRGRSSLGGELQTRGVASVPSPTAPSPGGAPYFSGGYNTARHGSREPLRTVSGVQIELPYAGMRDTEESRRAFAAALAAAVEAFLATHSPAGS